MSIWGPAVDARAERRKRSVFGTRRLSNWIVLPFLPIDLAAMACGVIGSQEGYARLSSAGVFGVVTFFAGIFFAVVVIALIGNVSPRVAWTGLGIWFGWALLAAGSVTGQPALVVAAGVYGPVGIITAIAVPVTALVRGPGK